MRWKEQKVKDGEIIRKHEVTCRGCDEVVETYAQTKAEVIKELKTYGWEQVYIPPYKRNWVCRYCLGKDQK